MRAEECRYDSLAHTRARTHRSKLVELKELGDNEVDGCTIGETHRGKMAQATLTLLGELAQLALPK